MSKYSPSNMNFPQSALQATLALGLTTAACGENNSHRDTNSADDQGLSDAGVDAQDAQIADAEPTAVCDPNLRTALLAALEQVTPAVCAHADDPYIGTVNKSCVGFGCANPEFTEFYDDTSKGLFGIQGLLCKPDTPDDSKEGFYNEVINGNGFDGLPGMTKSNDRCEVNGGVFILMAGVSDSEGICPIECYIDHRRE